MTEIFNKLATAGNTIESDDRVVYLLASLPESYDVVVTALEANETVPGMKTVIERLTHEEKKLRIVPNQAVQMKELWQLNTSRGEVQGVISVRNLDTFNATAENEKDQGRALSSLRSIQQK
uniref:Uncharacterized protein n=1 Tax=Amphimedon queenslandica TaxID=400682 RepID=A0A1X7TGU8_AMPQE